MTSPNKSEDQYMEDENQNNEQNSQNINLENAVEQNDEEEEIQQQDQQIDEQKENQQEDEGKNQKQNDDEEEEYEEINYNKNNDDENKENENNQNIEYNENEALDDYNQNDEGEDGEEQDEDQVGQKRRRNKEKKKKKRKNQEGNYDEQDLSEEQEQQQQQEPEEMHPITQKIKQLTHQIKKRKSLQNTNLVLEYAQMIQKEMDDLHQKDIECNKKNQPAINKLQAIDSLSQKLKHKSIQDQFLINGGLEKFVKWLSKMPDGSNPSQPLKKKVLQLIQKFQVDKEIIKGSQLGKIIMNFFKNTSETVEIRQLAKNIVNIWSRVISENVIDYHQSNEYDEDFDKEELEQIKKKLQINRQASNQDVELLNNKKVNKYVELPDQKQFAFYFNPKPNDYNDEENVQEISEKTKTTFKNLADLTRKKKI